MPHEKDKFKINELSVLCSNADCLCNKFNEFSLKISERNLHIIVVMEALPKNYSDLSVYYLPLNGYSLEVNVRAKRGIFVYISCSLSYSIVQDFQSPDLTESICIDVHATGPRKIIHSAAFYRISLLNDKFKCFCELSKNSCPFLVVGNFNLPKIDWQNLCTEASENSRERSFFYLLLFKIFFFQHVIEPTRLRSDQFP